MSDFDRLMGDSLKAIRDDHVREIERQIPAVRQQIATKIRRRRFTFVIGGVAVAAAAVAVALFLTQSVPNLDRSVPPANPDSDATVVDFPALTTTFVSPRNGFSIKHPDGSVLTPAEEFSGYSKQIDDGFDVVDTGSGAVFKGASTEFADGVYTDERIDKLFADDLPGSCGLPRSQQAEITIDGQSGRISECANRIEATVVSQDDPAEWAHRLYLFVLEHDRSDARAVFDALVATVELRPETADNTAGPSTTFVSPIHGYSFKHPHRVSFDPATELWDPVNQPAIDDFDSERAREMSLARYHRQFDGMETGMLAYFSAASTQIPDGVSIDEWVDEYVTPTLAEGCGVPRSQQEEITIDGKPGRICGHDATVVAGGRLYLFRGTDDRAWSLAWMDTIELTPETAAVP